VAVVPLTLPTTCPSSAPPASGPRRERKANCLQRGANRSSGELGDSLRDESRGRPSGVVRVENREDRCQKPNCSL
jgi:hypothetical protein